MCWMTGAILGLNDYLGNKNILSHVPTVQLILKVPCGQVGSELHSIGPRWASATPDQLFI